MKNSNIQFIYFERDLLKTNLKKKQKQLTSIIPAGLLSLSLCRPPQVVPGPGPADGRGLRHGEGLGRLRLLHEQRDQPAGAGQHLRRAVEDHQQEQRSGLLRVQPLRGHTQGGMLCVCVSHV